MPDAYSFLLSAVNRTKYAAAIEQVRAHFAGIADVWPSMTQTQKLNFIEHSPVFKLLFDLMRPFKDVM